MRILVIVCLAVLFLSCEKKELPIPKYDRGDVITTQIEMTPNYKNQIWFSLDKNQVISTNHKTDWDLAFENSVAGTHVFLNGSKSMRIYKTEFTNLNQVIDTAGLEVNSMVDAPSGNTDSTAIGDWLTNNTVYIVNRGYSESGQVQGFCKLKINSVSATDYSIEYGDVFGTTTNQYNVLKDGDYNFGYFSFTTNQQLMIEPEKTNYDLCFTQYTHVFYNPFQYYLVTGVLNNQYRTRVIKISDKPFAKIALSDTVEKTFSTNKNVIGYEWKTFSLTTNLYTIDPSMCYIINDNKGFYYKLHFIDFYNSNGIKGYPTFEFKKL